ncbi:MAG: calcium/sodium antiporter [Lachnospiraceae bacterium]|nr:calcium/sodium antiporter [Lachnospiraceae bacterium]
MLIDSVFLVIGLVLILAGANALTDGASSIARRFGISDLVVGLTVVAFGTSAPELVISIVSAINGSAELAIGNVVGSNLFNTLVIIGVTAMIVPIVITRSIMTNEIPLVALSSLVLLVMGNGPFLDDAPGMALNRVDGIVLLLFFAIFMRYTFSQAKNTDGASDPASEEASQKKPMTMLKSILWVIGGLAALIYGGDRFVAGASGIARGLGVSEAIIGLTIVAAGTSLPELATSVAAALKGKTGIALGNVIGSNIFNIFLVLGASATIRPLSFGSIGNFDLLTLMGASVLFWLFGWIIKSRTITRIEGALMFIVYLAYLGVLIANVS